ncbi:unnamed protein product, partial [Amoebophrya sp. A25]
FFVALRALARRRMVERYSGIGNIDFILQHDSATFSVEVSRDRLAWITRGGDHLSWQHAYGASGDPSSNTGGAFMRPRAGSALPQVSASQTHMSRGSASGSAPSSPGTRLAERTNTSRVQSGGFFRSTGTGTSNNSYDVHLDQDATGASSSSGRPG